MKTTTLEIGLKLVVDGDIRIITALNGRWVKLDDDSNISRTTAIAAHAEYLEDAAILGDELNTTSEDAQIASVPVGYVGPMLALRERLAAGAYSRAVNGQPCCGDAIAIKLGTLTPAQVIRACVIAMNLPANPYTHLNIGQQSMNLRNKLRGCLKRGEFGMGVVIEAVEVVEEQDADAKREAAVLASELAIQAEIA